MLLHAFGAHAHLIDIVVSPCLIGRVWLGKDFSLGRILVTSKVFGLTPKGPVDVCGQYACIHNNACCRSNIITSFGGEGGGAS